MKKVVSVTFSTPLSSPQDQDFPPAAPPTPSKPYWQPYLSQLFRIADRQASRQPDPKVALDHLVAVEQFLKQDPDQKDFRKHLLLADATKEVIKAHSGLTIDYNKLDGSEHIAISKLSPDVFAALAIFHKQDLYGSAYLTDLEETIKSLETLFSNNMADIFIETLSTALVAPDEKINLSVLKDELRHFSESGDFQDATELPKLLHTLHAKGFPLSTIITVFNNLKDLSEEDNNDCQFSFFTNATVYAVTTTPDYHIDQVKFREQLSHLYLNEDEFSRPHTWDQIYTMFWDNDYSELHKFCFSSLTTCDPSNESTIKTIINQLFDIKMLLESHPDIDIQFSVKKAKSKAGEISRIHPGPDAIKLNGESCGHGTFHRVRGNGPDSVARKSTSVPQKPSYYNINEGPHYVYIGSKKGSPDLKRLNIERRLRAITLRDPQTFTEAVAAITSYHDKGLVHNDIKEANIMRDPRNSSLQLIDRDLEKRSDELLQSLQRESDARRPSIELFCQFFPGTFPSPRLYQMVMTIQRKDITSKDIQDGDLYALALSSLSLKKPKLLKPLDFQFRHRCIKKVDPQLKSYFESIYRININSQIKKKNQETTLLKSIPSITESILTTVEASAMEKCCLLLGYPDSISDLLAKAEMAPLKEFLFPNSAIPDSDADCLSVIRAKIQELSQASAASSQDTSSSQASKRRRTEPTVKEPPSSV